MKIEKSASIPSHIVFNSLLDALAIVFGVVFGGMAWGYVVACWLFG